MIAIYSNATVQHAAEVRKIAKQFGVSKCSKKTNYVYVGSQLTGVSKENAHALMDAVKAAGYHIDGESTQRQLADKGLFSVMMVAKLAK